MRPAAASVAFRTFCYYAAPSHPDDRIDHLAKNLNSTRRAAMVNSMSARSATPPGSCRICAATSSSGLRRGLCRACYLRQWRGTALPTRATCSLCPERRRAVLRWTRVGTHKIVTCQNCGFVADKVRPRPRSPEELKLHLARERRRSRERRRDYVIDPQDPGERRLLARRTRRR
jgi:hypothetical protein